MNEKLKGKVAIVTGSGRGLGKAFAISMVKQGIEVCIAEIDKNLGLLTSISEEYDWLVGRDIHYPIQTEILDWITEFHIKRIYPPGGKCIVKLTPDEMLQYLEYKVLQHAPTCSSKDYLLKRVTTKSEHNSNFKRLNNYVKLLSK